MIDSGLDSSRWRLTSLIHGSGRNEFLVSVTKSEALKKIDLIDPNMKYHDGSHSLMNFMRAFEAGQDMIGCVDINVNYNRLAKMFHDVVSRFFIFCLWNFEPRFVHLMNHISGEHLGAIFKCPNENCTYTSSTINDVRRPMRTPKFNCNKATNVTLKNAYELINEQVDPSKMAELTHFFFVAASICFDSTV